MRQSRKNFIKMLAWLLCFGQVLGWSCLSVHAEERTEIQTELQEEAVSEASYEDSHAGTEAAAANCGGEGDAELAGPERDDSRRDEISPALEHEWLEVSRTEATCTEPGRAVYVCSRCGESMTEETEAALGHSWDDGQAFSAPDGEAEEERIFTCVRCGETYSEKAADPPETAETEAMPEKETEETEQKEELTPTDGEALPENPQTEETAAKPEKQQKKEPRALPERPVGDAGADLESADIWERQFEDLKLTGEWAEDLISVARSQFGYTESSLNFDAVPNEDGDDWLIKGWTRYGAWYGIPYGDWCAMFISFCLHYAGIEESDFPYDCATTTWVRSLKERGMYGKAGDYAPKAGDLIFFDWEVDGLADHVGIVYGVDSAINYISAIEGNHTFSVAAFDYALDDGRIMGYGILPEGPADDADEADENSAEGEEGTEPTAETENGMPEAEEAAAAEQPKAEMTETAPDEWLYPQQESRKALTGKAGNKSETPNKDGDQASRETGCTFAITGSVRMSGRAVREGEFHFQLKDSKGQVLQTRSNASDGTVTFDAMSYTAADMNRDEDGCPTDTQIPYFVSRVTTDGSEIIEILTETVTVTLHRTEAGTVIANPDKPGIQFELTDGVRTAAAEHTQEHEG